MDILFLGTSSGTPTKQRNVSATALIPENTSEWYLIDCGEGTQQQLLHTPLSLKDLRAILITHVHGDHCYGLPGLLASAAMHGRNVPLTLIAPEDIATWIQQTRISTELYLPFELNFIAVENLTTWQDDHVIVETALLSHRVPSYAYSFKEAKLEARLNQEKLQQKQIPKGEIWGRLKRGENVPYQDEILYSTDYLYYPYPARKIVVGGDNDQPERLTKLCEQAQVLIHEATYTQEIAEKVGDSVKHCAAATIAKFAENQQLPYLLLTHFSARYQADISKSPSIADIQNEAKAYYSGELHLAEDFTRYRLNKAGQLFVVLSFNNGNVVVK